MHLAIRPLARPWAAAFLLLLLLSQDFWFFWDTGLYLGPWNLPLRIYYFIGLQVLLAVLLALFFAHLSRRGPAGMVDDDK